MPDNAGVTTGAAIAPMPRAQAAASGPTSTPAARTMSRAEVVAQGKGGDAWGFVPVALAALRVEPGDDEVRFLLAAAYGRLVLRTAAMEQIARLSGPGRAEVAVQALAAALEQLPDDRVPVAELGAMCRANLDVLAGRSVEPVDLRGRFNAWKMLAGTLDWFRTRGGGIVRRTRGEGGGGGWVRWGDHVGAAAGMKVDGAVGVGGVGPSVVEGFDPPCLLARLVEMTEPTGNGYEPLVTVVERDEMGVLNGCAQVDLRSVLGQERVRVVVGADGVERWARTLEQRAEEGLAVTGPVYRVDDDGGECVSGILTHIGARQADVLNTLDAEVRERYAGRDVAWLGARFASALAADGAVGKGEPLRVLIPTCRYSTFIRHSAADLAEALRAMGCEARVLIEPDAHAQLTNVAYLKALAEFQPDLVVQINYARANMGGGGSGGVYPPGVVYATWVQDAMPHLFDKRIGAAHTRMDFLAGNLTENLFQSFGYPRSRAMHAPMAASTRKFHDGPVTTAQRERFACEIAYVSHHSETPEAMLERLLRESTQAPWMGAVARSVYPKVRELVEAPLVSDGPTLSKRLREIAAEALRACGARDDVHTVTQILSRCVHPLADRMLRHQTLAWAAEIAARRGWRMHLYGRGWETHPTLAAHARGELAHGDDLRACYQCARAHLQVSAHTVIHQRVFECVLSGGLPLCRLQADDLATMQFSAAARACGGEGCAVEPDACDPWTTLELEYRRIGYRAADHDGPREFNAMLRALGLPEVEFAWINPVLVERLSRLGRIEGQEHAPDRLLGDPGACMFHTSEGLERLLARTANDDAARERTRRGIADASRAVVTTDAFAHDLLRFITESLGRGDEPDGREWYDGRDGDAGPAPGNLRMPPELTPPKSR